MVKGTSWQKCDSLKCFSSEVTRVSAPFMFCWQRWTLAGGEGVTVPQHGERSPRATSIKFVSLFSWLLFTSSHPLVSREHKEQLDWNPSAAAKFRSG